MHNQSGNSGFHGIVFIQKILKFVEYIRIVQDSCCGDLFVFVKPKKKKAESVTFCPVNHRSSMVYTFV